VSLRHVFRPRLAHRPGHWGPEKPNLRATISMTTTLERPAAPAGALYVKTPITPEEVFKAIGRLRKEARDEIDRLIRFLDDTDNHMEREPDDEGDDAELEDDNPAEDDGLAEPSLGSIGNYAHSDQRAWAAGGRRDLEQDDGESGIGDRDGLDEQVPFRDWQMVGMV
jgi:hypothetical protein